MGTEVDTSNGEKQLNDFINENRTIRFSVEPTKSSISASYRTIKDELKNKPPIYFNVAIRKSSINQAMSDLRDEIAKAKPITVSVVPNLDVDSTNFAGKNNVARIKKYFQSLLSDVEVTVKPKFDMKSIRASIRNMKQELSKDAGKETEVKANISVNKSGNIVSAESLNGWLKSLRKFANFASRVPSGEINLKINLGANIDAGFKQLINSGLDLSKIKGGKLDINVNDGDSSTVSSRHKGGNSKNTISDDVPDTIPKPQIIPAMARSRIIEVINNRFNTDAKNLVEAIEKSSGISLSGAGRNIGVHIQSAMSKLAKEAEDRVIQGDKEGAQAIKNLVGKLRNMYAGQDPYLREMGGFTNLTDGQIISKYTKLATQDSNISLDSDRYSQIDASNKERRAYLDNLRREQELFVKIAKDKDALWKHGAEQLAREIEVLWETNKRLFKNNKSDPQVESKLAEVHNLQNKLASGDVDVANAVQKYFANKAKEIANLLEYAKAENSDILEAFRISGMQGINTTKVFNNLNPLNHGEILENLASQRANMSGDYWAGAEHKRKANDLRKERLDPLQKEIDDLIVARNKGEKGTLGTNPELMNLINTKLRLMSEIGGADFGLKQQIDYIKSLKNKNIDTDAHGMIEKLLNQMNKELAESFRGTIEDRIKYYKKQISDTFKQIKDKSARGEDVTSEVNNYMGFRSKLLEAQSQQSGGASVDYSGASKGMLALANIKGIDSKLLADIKQAESEFRELAKAQSAAGDTAKKLANEYEALKAKLSGVTSSGDISDIASKMESNLMTRFGRGDNVNRDIQALSQMATSLNNKGLDGEPIAKLARRMKELSDEAKKVTQTEQQATKAQTVQNQAVIEAEKELERLARELDNVYRGSSKLQRVNPFSGPVKEAADRYKQKLEEIYRLKRQIGELRSDGDVARELLGRSTISGNSNFHSAVNSRIQSIFESLAGKFGREDAQSRARAGRASIVQNVVGWGTYGAKFLGRSAKGTGSALEASSMGLSDAFKLFSSSVGIAGKGLGALGMLISLFTGGMAVGIEVTTKLFGVFERLIGVVYRLLQPGIELYKQVTKATYSMGASIASNAKFGEQQVSLATGIATSANLQRKAMLDAEVSVFDFSEIIQSLSGTLPILLGKGMSVEEAYQTNLGVASVAKLTNLAPNQVLQETRDLAQGSITARSSQVANALNITNEDIRGKSADEIFKIFTDKFKNYKEVLTQYAETPVGAFEQMTDRLRTVSMKFVEEIAYPFKEMFNWLTDFTGSWVDKEQHKLTRVDMGDGTTEQFWLKGGIDTKNDGAKFSLQEAKDMLGGDLTKLTDAIERAIRGNTTTTDNSILSQFGLDSSSLVGSGSKDDILNALFGNITKSSGEAEFFLGPEFDKLKKSFVDIFKYLGSALDDILTHISDTFGTTGATDVIDLFTEAIKWLIDVTKDSIEWTITLIKGLIDFVTMSEAIIDIIGAIIKISWNCMQIIYDMIAMGANSILLFFELLASGINKLIGWVSDKLGIGYDTKGNQSRIDYNIEYLKKQYMDGLYGVSGDFEDIMEIFGHQKESKNKSTFFLDKILKGLENMEKQIAKRDVEKGEAKDQNLLRGTPKDKVDEKALREARNAEKKAFDKFIAQLREALEKHIQDLKDLQEKNEVYYKQGLTNYSDYITNKINYDLDEQRSKRDELLSERQLIQSTNKYENEDDREKDLANNQREIDKVQRSIRSLETVQGEATEALNKATNYLGLLNQNIALLITGINRTSVGAGGVTTTNVSVANVANNELMGMALDNSDVDSKRNWAMQYIQNEGYSLQQAAGILGNLMIESAYKLDPFISDPSGEHRGIAQWDDTRYQRLIEFANSIGTDISNASDFFKAQVAYLVKEMRDYGILPDASVSLYNFTDLFNTDFERSGAITDPRYEEAKSALSSFNQIIATTTTKVTDSVISGLALDSGINVNGGVSLSGAKAETIGMINTAYLVYKRLFGRDDFYLTSVTDSHAPGTGHGDGYKADIAASALEESKANRELFQSELEKFGMGANNEYDNPSTWSTGGHFDLDSRGTNWIDGVNHGGFKLGLQSIEKFRELGYATKNESLEVINKLYDYLLKPIELAESISKYTQPKFGSVADIKASSAEYAKMLTKFERDLATVTGVDDKQQKELRDLMQRLQDFQLQEVIANKLKQQADSVLDDIEAQFNFDIASSASRLDFNSIADKYDGLFSDMNNSIGKTIESIRKAIDDADKAGNKTVAKDLRQTLNKFTIKLSEFFGGAEQAINKQYEYVETAINNIGATSLQKEGMNRRFNVEKNSTLAKMYAKQEDIYGSIYKNQTNDALDELHRNGELSAETLQKLADTETKLTQIHWAKQQAEELGEFKEQLEEANDVFKQALEDGLVDYMTDGVNAVLDGTKSIGDAFRELATSILKTMQQFFAKRMIEGLMDRLYPNLDKEKQIVDTANWQPKDLLSDPSKQQIYQQQMNNPALQPYMIDGHIIKNAPSGDVYGPINKPEYEALSPVVQLRDELNELGGSAKSASDALWQIRDYYSGEVKYPDTAQAQMSVDNLAQSMDKASLSTDMNTSSTEANTMAETNSTATEMQSNLVDEQGITLGEQSNLQAQQHTTDVMNDTVAIKQHSDAVRNDSYKAMSGGQAISGKGESSDAGVGVASHKASGSFGGNFITNLMGSDFMQLAGGLFATHTLFTGDTKEKLLSAIFIELQLIYTELIKMSTNLITRLGFATGGYVSGPGTSTSDSIPAMLSNSEYVINAKAVRKYGTNFLDAVNNGTFVTIKPRHQYASGGLVTETAREATSTVVTELGRGIGTNINNEAHFNLVMASNQEDAMRAFMRSPEGQRIYLDMARKYASTTVKF